MSPKKKKQKSNAGAGKFDIEFNSSTITISLQRIDTMLEVRFFTAKSTTICKKQKIICDFSLDSIITCSFSYFQGSKENLIFGDVSFWLIVQPLFTSRRCSLSKTVLSIYKRFMKYFSFVQNAFFFFRIWLFWPLQTLPRSTSCCSFLWWYLHSKSLFLLSCQPRTTSWFYKTSVICDEHVDVNDCVRGKLHWSITIGDQLAAQPLD